MGLSLAVGILADLHQNDPDGEAVFRGYFDMLNRFLATTALEPHREPQSCDGWSADMYGYSGLHYLRRLAAHVDLTAKLPSPGDETSSDDPVLNNYFDDVTKPRRGFVGRLFARRQSFARTFDHLIVHSDAEGFYLPADFRDVLIVPSAYPVPGAMIGSVPRLLREISRLSGLLGIPDSLDSQSEELWEAIESQGAGDTLWKRYGIEAYSCVVLKEGCQASLRTGAALAFV